jgi:hypothetical protein
MFFDLTLVSVGSQARGVELTMTWSRVYQRLVHTYLTSST